VSRPETTATEAAAEKPSTDATAPSDLTAAVASPPPEPSQIASPPSEPPAVTTNGASAGAARGRRRRRRGDAAPDREGPPPSTTLPPLPRVIAAPTRRPSAPVAAPRYPEEMAPEAVTARGRGSLRPGDSEGEHVFAAGNVNFRVATAADPANAGVLKIDVRVGDRPWLPLLTDAGMLLRDRDGRVLSPAEAAGRVTVESCRATARGKTLSLRYTELFEGTTLRRTVQIRLVGQALVIQVQANAGKGPVAYGGLTMPVPEGKGLRATSIPYCPEPLFVVGDAGFASVYLDRLMSGASTITPDTAIYLPNTAGEFGEIRETAYVALGSDPLTVLPLLPQPASVYRQSLGNRLFLDLHNQESYVEDRRRLEELWRYGLHDIALILRNWRHFGEDRRLPSHYPANPERGSNEEFRALVATAQAQGWLVALAEEYVAITEDGAYWDPHAVARDSEGRFRPGARPQWAIAADKMHSFARLEATLIRRNYRPNASFLGLHTAVHPESVLHQVDREEANQASATVADVVAWNKQLCQSMRSIHDGPVFGEGGSGTDRFDTYYAGYVDAVERSLDAGRVTPVLPDFELQRVHPLCIGYGLGRYGHFYRADRGEGPVAPDVGDWDCYRATTIAFGHAGYLSTADLADPGGINWSPLGRIDRAFTEYFMLRGLQAEYLSSAVRQVEYWDGKEWLDLGRLLRSSADVQNVRLRVSYENGLTVWVNRHARSEWSVSASGKSYTLPPNGWLALNPETGLVTYSALVSGGRADVMRCASYRFLNSRSTVARRIEGMTTDGAAAIVRSSVPGREDLFLVGGRTLAEEVDLIKSSERVDFSVIHKSEREAEVLLLDSENGRSSNVTLHYFSSEWQQARLGLQERFEGSWRRAPNQVQHTKRGVQIARMLPGVLYRLFLP
jgi:hypothetical protein